MYQDDDNDFQPNLESWVINKCDQWRDHYETNYSEKFDEYYRIWRGIWDKSDSMRDSERSRIISPATQQAVESAVAEVEEATFGRGKFFDIRDDVRDVRKEDIQLIRAQLEEDMHFTKARSNIRNIFISTCRKF
jgi:tRNA G10  N-methylase Trm11